MFVVYYGFEFDVNGHTVRKAHTFDTLEQASGFCNDVCRKTGEILAVQFESERA